MKALAFSLLLTLLSTISAFSQSARPEIKIQLGHLAVESVAFSPDGKFFASGGGDNLVILWEISSGKEIRTFDGHDSQVVSLAFSPDGKYLFSAAVYDTAIKQWDVSSGQERRAFSGHSHGIRDIKISPDGKYLLSGSDDKTMKLWDIASGKEIKSFSGHATGVTSVTFSLTANMLFRQISAI